MTALTISRLARGWPGAIDQASIWQPPTRSTLVVVPHPDDESLSTGGLIAHLRRRNIAVTVLAVTDGGAAYPRLVTGDRLATIRRIEQERAVHDLGGEAGAVIRLGIPDGGVPAAEDELAQAIAGVLVDRAIEHVVAPWTHDHHSDHEACGRAATTAAAEASVPITYGLFWALFHTPDPVFGDRRLRRLPLSADDQRDKLAAIGRHRSQVTTDVSPEPVLGSAELLPTEWSNELFIVDEVVPT